MLQDLELTYGQTIYVSKDEFLIASNIIQYANFDVIFTENTNIAWIYEYSPRGVLPRGVARKAVFFDIDRNWNYSDFNLRLQPTDVAYHGTFRSMLPHKNILKFYEDFMVRILFSPIRKQYKVLNKLMSAEFSALQNLMKGAWISAPDYIPDNERQTFSKLASLVLAHNTMFAPVNAFYAVKPLTISSILNNSYNSIIAITDRMYVRDKNGYTIIDLDEVLKFYKRVRLGLTSPLPRITVSSVDRWLKRNSDFVSSHSIDTKFNGTPIRVFISKWKAYNYWYFTVDSVEVNGTKFSKYIDAYGKNREINKSSYVCLTDDFNVMQTISDLALRVLGMSEATFKSPIGSLKLTSEKCVFDPFDVSDT